MGEVEDFRADTIPSISSSTTTGGAKRFGTTATVIAATAATTTIAKKEPVSTSIAAIGRAVKDVILRPAG